MCLCLCTIYKLSSLNKFLVVMSTFTDKLKNTYDFWTSDGVTSPIPPTSVHPCSQDTNDVSPENLWWIWGIHTGTLYHLEFVNFSINSAVKKLQSIVPFNMVSIQIAFTSTFTIINISRTTVNWGQVEGCFSNEWGIRIKERNFMLHTTICNSFIVASIYFIN